MRPRRPQAHPPWPPPWWGRRVGARAEAGPAPPRQTGPPSPRQIWASQRLGAPCRAEAAPQAVARRMRASSRVGPPSPESAYSPASVRAAAQPAVAAAHVAAAAHAVAAAHALVHEPPAAPLPTGALARTSRWWAATAVSHWCRRVAQQETLTLTLNPTLALTLPAAPTTGLRLCGVALAAAPQRAWARTLAAWRGSPAWTRASGAASFRPAPSKQAGGRTSPSGHARPWCPAAGCPTTTPAHVLPVRVAPPTFDHDLRQVAPVHCAYRPARWCADRCACPRLPAGSPWRATLESC